MLVPREFVTVLVDDTPFESELVDSELPSAPNGQWAIDSGPTSLGLTERSSVSKQSNQWAIDGVHELTLLDIAYGRSGDKGDICNVGIVARTAELVPVLRQELTAERVKAYLAHLVEGEVTRYELPGLNAFNFVMTEALDGGGTSSLRFDPLGKGMAQILLEMPISVPVSLLQD